MTCPLSSSLTLEIDSVDGERVLRVGGELDLASADELIAACALLCEEPGEFVIELSELRFVDVAGLRALEHAVLVAGRSGCPVRMESPAPPLRRLWRQLESFPVRPVTAICQAAGWVLSAPE